jgi:hypothetical protein
MGRRDKPSVCSALRGLRPPVANPTDEIEQHVNTANPITNHRGETALEKRRHIPNSGTMKPLTQSKRSASQGGSFGTLIRSRSIESIR